jgi:prepilin-type N-terminal cleavage/methylation domain-containing protein
MKKYKFQKGFTLIELMIVLIIIGVLATLAIQAYQSAIEKSRGAEAKTNLGRMRSLCAEIYMRDNNVSECMPEQIEIGSRENNFPAECAPSHYFSYNVTEVYPEVDGNVISFIATRCTSGGKPPNGKYADYIMLTVDYDEKLDTWKSNGGY